LLGADARRAADAARGVAGRLEPELARRGAVEQPGLEHALVDQLDRQHRQPLAVERPRAQPARAVRIVADRDALREDLLPERVQEEAGLARDRRAADRAEQMPEQPRRDAAIEHHRHRPAGDLGGIEPRHRALAGAAADRLGRLQHRAWRAL
jgi:hypothetical protein